MQNAGSRLNLRSSSACQRARNSWIADNVCIRVSAAHWRTHVDTAGPHGDGEGQVGVLVLGTNARPLRDSRVMQWYQ